MMLNWLPYDPPRHPERDALIYATTNAGIDTIEAIIRRHSLPVSYRRDGTLSVFTSRERAEKAHAKAEYLRSIGPNDDEQLKALIWPCSFGWKGSTGLCWTPTAAS